MTRKMERKHRVSEHLNDLIKGENTVKYLVDVPKKLFEIFSEKYGAGKSEERIIDRDTYLIQPLTIETTAWHAYQPWRDEGKSVVTIGLRLWGKEESRHEVTQFFVWNHIPETCSVESLSVWAGIHGLGNTRRERVIMRLGNTSDAFNPIVPEASFIAEVIAMTYRIGKDLKPRRYAWQNDSVGYVLEEIHSAF